MSNPALNALLSNPVPWLVLGAAAVAALAGAVLGAGWAGRRVGAQLRDLEAQTRRIGQGDYAPARPVSRHDPVSRLRLALNNMTRAISEREHRIRFLALHEPVTQLPNRAALIDRLATSPEGARGAVMAIGLVRSQEIANTVGRDIANRVLRHIAQRLAGLLGDVPLACLNDRCLAAFLPDLGELRARSLAATVLEHFDTPYTDGDLTIDTAVAVGIALRPVDGSDPAHLLERAEVALTTALHSDPRWSVYDSAADPHRPDRLSLMSELRRGLAADEFILLFQPKLHVPSGQIRGAEALVRWRHPRRGMVPPDEFVGLAEETGNVRHLTRWALRTGIAQAAAWRAEGLNIQVAINLSARDLSDARLPATVARLLEEQGMDSAAISLEVTESEIMEDPDAAVAVLRGFAERGLWVALDDFGAGRTSLAYLRTLPVREIKIDKGFIQSLVEKDGARKIVRSVIELGHGLDLAVSVEGVEDAATLDVLAELGCDYVQGYHIARPLVAELLANLAREKGRGVAAA